MGYKNTALHFKMKNCKNLFLLLVIFAILFLGAINIGPISIRNLCVLGLLFPIVIKNRNIQINICVKCYFIYLLFLIVSNILNGQILGTSFLRSFFSGHFVCIILVLSFPLLIKTTHELKTVVLLCVCCYMCNTIISIFQFYNINLGWSIGLLINPGAIKFMEMAEYYMEGANNFLDRSIVFGLNGFVVQNGYFATVFLPVVTHSLFFCTNSKWRKLFDYLILLLGIVTIFMIQQRMAFALLLLYLISIIYFKTGASMKIILIGFSIIVVLLLSDYFTLNMGRLTTQGIGLDSRMNQVDNFISFFNSNDFILGAFLDNKELGNSLGHNTLMDSLRRGGFLTFVVYCVTFFILTITCIKQYILAYKEQYTYTFAFATSCIIFMCYSFTHSTGIQSGAIYFWFMYSMMLVSYNIENKNEDIVVD